MDEQNINSDGFVEKLNENTDTGIIYICDYTLKIYGRDPGGIINYYDFFIEVFGLIQAFHESRGIKLDIPTPSIQEDKSRTIEGIIQFLATLKSKTEKVISVSTLDTYKQKYLMKFNSGFYFEFTEGDLEKIQRLINELRTYIQKTNELTDDHKNRLFKKLEKLQSELHKKTSTLDYIYGFIGDAGTLIYKLGNDAKPIVDRIRELVDIAWRVQTLAEQLPSGSPRILLEPSKEPDISKDSENLT